MGNGTGAGGPGDSGQLSPSGDESPDEGSDDVMPFDWGVSRGHSAGRGHEPFAMTSPPPSVTAQPAETRPGKDDDRPDRRIRVPRIRSWPRREGKDSPGRGPIAGPPAEQGPE
jgi:hypothetical protein